MAGSKEVPVSESLLGKPGPAMAQAMLEFSGSRPDAPASLGEPLLNAYDLQKRRDAEAESYSYRVRGSGRYARGAAEDFYTEEYFGDVDLGYQA